jgi:hypothetical protein
MGLSVADCVTPEMLLSMAKDPDGVRLSNPNPEIGYEFGHGHPQRPSWQLEEVTIRTRSTT